MNSYITFFIGIIFFLFLATIGFAQNEFPGEVWKQYTDIEEAGFSKEKIAEAKEAYDQSEAAALLVVHDGKILVDWGENTRKFMVHSIRKSFLNSLIGIYVAKGDINLNQTLAELNIAEKTPLTNKEKQATIVDLLGARSGIYLPSAYSPRGMEDNLPARGSHDPGTYWYYNNWDFNTLGTIFEQATGEKIFSDFQKQVAAPLMMEDFEETDGHYLLESDKSIHPAYLFRASARDMARFGLLYLNKGRWGSKQIVPEIWVDASTKIVSKDLGNFNHKGGFGYLWWISDGVNGQPMYYASGSGGHRIMILPESNMVIVQRANTYERNNISEAETLEIVSMILEAKTGDPSPELTLVDYIPEKNEPDFLPLDSIETEPYLGKYKHQFLGDMTISRSKSSLLLEIKLGTFKMFPLLKNRFYPEDLETPVIFHKTENEALKMSVHTILGDNQSVKKVIFYY